jgi:hypothetical protein
MVWDGNQENTEEWIKFTAGLVLLVHAAIMNFSYAE